MNGIIGFICGFILGCWFGAFIICLVIASRTKGEKNDEDLSDNSIQE